MATVLAASCLTAALASLCVSIPLRLDSQLRSQRSKSHIYQDRDGEASQDTNEPSCHLCTKFLLLASPLCAFVASGLSAARQALEPWSWLISSAWLVICVHTILLLRTPAQERRFTIGLLVALSSLVLTAGSAVMIYASPHGQSNPAIESVLQLLQLVSGILLIITSTSLPRRPAVFFNGGLVDGQHTCSVIERISYSWVQPLLRQARQSRCVEYSDLPMLDHYTRSQNLEMRFSGSHIYTAGNPLWKHIVRDHFYVFLNQWLLAVFESVVMMAPLVCLYKVLSIMEDRSSVSTDNTQIYLWVGCLTISKLLHVGLENWLNWIDFGMLATPIRSQLSALIFAKCLRIKIVTGKQPSPKAMVPVADMVTSVNDSDETDMLLPPSEPEEVLTDPANNDDTDNSAAEKGVFNLLAVDVQRVSDFCGYNVDLVRGAVKILLAAAFLVTLLGWWSTLSGLLVPLLLQPIIRLATQKYTDRQLTMMSARDNKAHVVTEALHGSRQIKLSSTEAKWEKLILTARERELSAQWSVYVFGTFLTVCWISMPTIIGATAISVYAWLSQDMKASVAFTALSLFSSLEWTIGVIPTTITEMLDARVSINRIEQHLNSDEKMRALQMGERIEFNEATVAWPSDSTDASTSAFTLRRLNVSFPLTALSVIQGKTGSGKSLLLNAIIGEADIMDGEVRAPYSTPMASRQSVRATAENWIISSAFAYVSQVPWIENASVRSTILYGLPYHEARYKQVLHACALADDIKMLPDGEDTEIGATGINLSGGQRWRLTLARALYSRAGILVLDDLLSAVDTHVGRHLLQHGILGALGKGRTIILATHHMGLVERFASYVVHLGQAGDEIQTTTQVPEVPHAAGPSINDSKVRGGAETSTQPAEEGLNGTAAIPRKFVEDEVRSQGHVKWSVYMKYVTASGGSLNWIFMVLLFGLAAGAVLARSYWLSYWLSLRTETHTRDTSASHLQAQISAASDKHLVFYLSIYIGISVVSLILVCFKVIFVVLASLRAAKQLFEKLTAQVLRAQLRWLDTEPVGRVLNRFVGDFALIDSRLGGDVMWCVNGLLSLLTIITAALFVSLWMLLPITILASASLYVTYLYISGARDIKRLESTAKSPMFELVSSSLTGLATIRAFNNTDEYMSRMYAHIDRYAQSSWYVLLCSQWMSFRQGLLGVVFTFLIAYAVAGTPSIGASLAGFALSFALDFSTVSEQTINRYTNMELDMNSTERVLEYHNLPTEPQTGEDVDPAWPTHGKININGLEVGYAEGLESVLKGIDIAIEPHQRIGIVGRTGSGKSSLTLALFRLLEARQGSIEIDGIDIAKLKLHDLRSRLAIIPQDPVLFSGTLRSNLDPFGENPDALLMDTLMRVNLLGSETGIPKHNKNIFRNLSSPVSRGGSNLSQGEKQLLCLARAMLARSKVIVLDEATSAVDMQTDALIQRSIREEFRDSTLLVVAHRLSTVADFDKILVLSQGKVVEYDRPEVLAKQRGAFWKMLKDSGEKDALQHLLR